LPDFFVAYGQNTGKNGQNGCFLKKFRPKSQNLLTMAIFIFIGVSNGSEGSIFFAKKRGFAKEASFTLKQQFLQ